MQLKKCLLPQRNRKHDFISDFYFQRENTLVKARSISITICDRHYLDKN